MGFIASTLLRAIHINKKGSLPSKLTTIGLVLDWYELRTNTAFGWAAEVVVVVVVVVVDVTPVVVVVSKQLKFSQGQPAAQLL